MKWAKHETATRIIFLLFLNVKTLSTKYGMKE
jgi:hypothetical protein